MRLIDADALMQDIEHYHLSDGMFQHWVEIQPTVEERKTTIEFPHVFIAEGYDSIKSEDGETGFGVYDPENKQIFIAGAVPDEIFVKALLHELMHWVQDISGYAFNEGEANAFAENIYNTMEPYIVARRWIPCSERRPEKSGQYYVSGGDKVWICEFYIIPNLIGGWCNDVSNPVVQAWMPLPEPYKEG